MPKTKLDKFIDKMMKSKKKFPYKQYTSEQLKSEVKKLQKYSTKKLITKSQVKKFANDFKYAGKILFTIEPARVGNIVSDYFFQSERMKARMGAHPSPISQWKNPKSRRRLFNGMVKLNKKKLEYNEPQLRASMRLYFSMTPQFKVSVAKCIYDKYKPSVVLDFSAGWGDRLAGFYGSKYPETYIGIDPNEHLKMSYSCMKKFLNKIIPDKTVKMIYKPAEKVHMRVPVDLIFTSPPYFDLEHYSDSKTQSDVAYDNVETWLDNFLFTFLDNNLCKLKSSGHLILQISDYNTKSKERVNIVKPLQDYMKSLKNFRYKGIILVKTKGRRSKFITEPLFVWQKK